MFRRMSFVGLSVLVTASSVWAQAPGGVQRMHGQAVENRSVRPVAGPSQGSGAKKTGGVLGGLRGLFGGGGGGDSSDAPQRSTGAVPDAPIGQIGPMEDWSDLSHSPATRQGASQAPRTSPGTSTAPKVASVPKSTSGSNIPKPPPAGTQNRTVPSDEIVATPKSSATKPQNSGVPSVPPVSTSQGGRRTTSGGSAGAPANNSAPADDVGNEPVTIEPEPKVSRRTVPQRSTKDVGTTPKSAPPAPKVATAPAESNIAAEEATGSGVGRRPARTDQPGMSAGTTTPTTPPSLNTAETPAPALVGPSPTTLQQDSTESQWGAAPKANRTAPGNNVSKSVPPSGVTNGSASSSSTSAANTNVAPNTSSAPGVVANFTTAMTEIPAVRVTTKGPDEIPINQVIEYEILVENRGAADAPGLLIRASLPESTSIRGHHVTNGEAVAENEGGERRMLWQVDRVVAGGSEKMVLRIAAEKAAPFQVTVEWTVLPQTNVASVRVQEPKLELHVDGPDEVTFGKTQIYKVRVLNPGTGNATGVSFTLSPNSATPQSQRLGDIPAGKEATFEIELSAQDRGELEIHGLVTATGELRSEQIKKIKVAAADLVATLDGPPLKYQNTEASYRLLLVNEGTAPCQNVVAQLKIPSGVEYIGGITGAEIAGDTLRWQVAELQPGQNREYNIRCNMTTTGSHLLAFDCQGTASGAAAVSIATKVEAVADLVLTVNDPTAPAPVNSEVVYEILVKNRGSKAATDIKAIAQFSQFIEPVRAEGQNAKLVPGQVLFDPIARLEPGQEIKLKVHAVAADGGVHRFRAEVTSGEVVLVAEEATKYINQTGERVSRRSNETQLR